MRLRPAVVFSAALAVAGGNMMLLAAGRAADAPAPAPQPEAGDATHRPMLKAPALRADRPAGGALIARQPLPKKPDADFRLPAEPTGKLVVKFHDHIKARTGSQGVAVSRSSHNLAPFQELVKHYGLTLLPAINRSEAELAQLEARAAAQSGKAQPDLAGMLYLIGPDAVLVEAARAINQLAEVEFVEIEQQMKTGFRGVTGGCCVPLDGAVDCDVFTEDFCESIGGVYLGDNVACPGACPAYGACCIIDTCVTLEQGPCLIAGGSFQGVGSNCIQDEDVCEGSDDEIECGDENAGDCYTAHPNRACEDAECCQLVAQYAPFCEEIIWNSLCASLANYLCDDGDTCLAPFVSGNCLEPHIGWACNDSDCCQLVCAELPICCEINSEWDQTCVNLAIELCGVDTPGATPDFTGADRQKYDTPSPSGAFAANYGFDGSGLDMPAVYGLGQELFEVYGIGEANFARGRKIRVGVIEHSAYVKLSKATGHIIDWPGHEDLRQVTCEPGQTPLLINQGNISVHHGTACLGEIVAAANGFGVTGLAPDAQGYFFPIVSAEEGGRLLSALTSAMLTFQPGDVLNFSIGPGGCGTLVSGETVWTMIRMATDLGITCCISAGNDCCNLDTAGQFDGEDSGAIIVGACTAGSGWCRLGFSNHCRDCTPGDSEVHISAWGTAIVTCGYGSLFIGNGDPNRSYASSFGGTSGAAPMIAGLSACLQGLAKQFYGIPLDPEAIRACVRSDTWCQCNVCNDDFRPGNDENPCVGDLDPDADSNIIGGFPDASASAVAVIAGNWFGSSFGVDQIDVIRGRLLLGSLFSVRGSEDSYLVVESKFTQAGQTANAPGNPRYNGTGYIADVLGTISVGAVPDVANIFVEAHVSTPFGLLFVELFNTQTSKWDFVGFSLMTQQDNGLGATFANASRYFDSSGTALIRAWTLTYPSAAAGSFQIGGGAAIPKTYYDFIGLQPVNQDAE